MILRGIRFGAGQGHQHAADNAMLVLIKISAVRGGVGIVPQNQLVAFLVSAQLNSMFIVQPCQPREGQRQ